MAPTAGHCGLPAGSLLSSTMGGFLSGTVATGRRTRQAMSAMVEEIMLPGSWSTEEAFSLATQLRSPPSHLLRGTGVPSLHLIEIGLTRHH